MVRLFWLAPAAALVLVGCVREILMEPSQRPIPTDARSMADGRKIADAQCGICHGLDREDAPRADAPALRNVLANYPAKSLRQDFESGIIIGHPDMPDFVFGPLGADVLLSYLRSIEESQSDQQ